MKRNALPLMLALMACTTSPPSLVVVTVDAEPGVRAATRSFTMRVEGRAPSGDFAEEFMEVFRGDAWGRSFTLGPRNHDTSRSYRVTLVAHGGANGDGTEVARNSLVSGYVQSQTRHYELTLFDACRGVTCGEEERCDRAGNCVAAEVPVMDLLPYDAGGPDAREDSDGGPRRDAPATIDATTSIDAGRDASPRLDAGPRTDATLPSDSGAPDIRGLELDSGTGRDAGGDAGRDAGRDSSVQSDGGSGSDSSTPSDGGSPGSDGSVSVDAPGPSCNGEGMSCAPSAECVATATVTCMNGEATCTPTTFQTAGTPCGSGGSGLCQGTCSGFDGRCVQNDACTPPNVCCTQSPTRCGPPGC